MEGLEYISSNHFFHFVDENCPTASHEPREHGHALRVESDSGPRNFAIIEQLATRTYLYYDVQAAKGQTTLNCEPLQKYDIDHVKNRIVSRDKSRYLSEYLDQHRDRLSDSCENAPHAPLLGPMGGDQSDRLCDLLFGNNPDMTDGEFREAFKDEVEERNQQLNNQEEDNHSKFDKMFGYRIELLKKHKQPDIALELLLLGAYRQVVDGLDGG
jgi:hypothetical protein